MLIVGITILINREHYCQLVADFGASPFQIYLSGTMDLLIGILEVCFHNIWEWRWPLIITVIGWIFDYQRDRSHYDDGVRSDHGRTTRPQFQR